MDNVTFLYCINECACAHQNLPVHEDIRKRTCLSPKSILYFIKKSWLRKVSYFMARHADAFRNLQESAQAKVILCYFKKYIFARIRYFFLEVSCICRNSLTSKNTLYLKKNIVARDYCFMSGHTGVDRSL